MTQLRKTLNIVGAGRVGQTLAHLWHAQGALQVQDVMTTSVASAQAACAFIGTGTPVATMTDLRPADVWMFATPDAQIASAVAQLVKEAPAVQHTSAQPIAFHCSGAQSSELLDPLAACDWQVASAHCILSFATAAQAVRQFQGTPCALEGSEQARSALQALFETIGAQCFAVQKSDKLLYHAAAVFATNFLPVLQSVAESAWQAVGVPPELLPHLRTTLLHNAVANIVALGPQQALTGPAARGDKAAIARQTDVVKQWDPASGAAYEALSQLALRLAGKA